MSTDQDLFYELTNYTLTHPDKAFIHQHVVDAFTAQTADRQTKPIALVFALVGLYMMIEKGYTGRQVQLFHMLMAKNKQPWPRIRIPKSKGDITISDVIAAKPGVERDEMIKKWSINVLNAYKESWPIITNLINHYQFNC
jgi:hypothetical protein